MTRGRPIPTRCVQTGKLYATLMDAFRDNGISRSGPIWRRALLGYPVRGMLFDPVEPDDPDWALVPRRSRQLPGHNARRVVCVETGKVYPSGRAAARSLGVSPNAIYQAIYKNYRACGYHWNYCHD